MKAGRGRTEIAGNHVLRDDAEEVGRDQTTYVFLSQIKNFVLWRLKPMNNVIIFIPHSPAPLFLTLLPTVRRMDYR